MLKNDKNVYIDLIKENKKIYYKNKNNEEYNTVLKKRNENELKINNIMKTIPFFNIYFQYFEKYQILKNVEINEKRMNIIESNDYILFFFLKKEYIPFELLFSQKIKPNHLIGMILESYLHMLNGLIILHKNNIFYNNINKNVLFFEKGKNLPILNDFSKSILISENNESNKDLFNKKDNYDLSLLYLPLISYIIHSNSSWNSDHFFFSFQHLLRKNTSENILKRETLENTYKIYNDLFEKETNWK